MSWQRIDENTYIDDTMVTCAEYQLFIDEMHEQGKYYQPDHWTSYQFPARQARKPIVGVRHSDAVAFYEWLTRREGGEWNYRLPAQQEVRYFPMRPLAQRPLGYWVNEEHRFEWVSPIPKDARRVDIVARKHALAFARTLDRNPNRPLERIRQGYLDRKRAHDRVSTLNHEFGSAVDRARTRPLDLSLAVALYRGIDLSLSLSLAADIDRYININGTRARGRGLDPILEEFNFRARSLPTYLDRASASARDRALKLTLDIFNDIFTLQERIAGRSPAFEGIRLVKYRELS